MTSDQLRIHGLRPTTRHITTHDETGKSIFVSVEQPPQFAFRTMDFGVARLYGIQQVPAAHLKGDYDLKGYMNPSKDSPTSFARVSEELTIPDGVNFTQLDMAPGAYIGMHRTVSVDFVAVVEGEVFVELDSGESTVLKRGDTIIQRATMHAWKNNSSTVPARMITSMVATNAVDIAGKQLEDTGL